MPSHQGGSMRPDDGDALRQALRSARARASLPVAFGGEVRGGLLHLTQFIGTRTAALRGLAVRAEAGLGGLVLAHRKPAGVPDYGSADWITHDYDGPVLAEGISSVAAAPVVVDGAVRGVLYGAARGPLRLGDRVTDALLAAARGLAQELTVRDEVDRRLRLRDACEATGGADPGLPLDEIRELHAELRALAQTVGESELRERLLDASWRLAGLGRPQGREPSTEPAVQLSPRETDVLAQVALGCSNAEAGARLSLMPETVKAYLRSAMRKLGAHTRFEAVVAARRAGLLP